MFQMSLVLLSKRGGSARLMWSGVWAVDVWAQPPPIMGNTMQHNAGSAVQQTACVQGLASAAGVGDV
jgi:hypothetical protein